MNNKNTIIAVLLITVSFLFSHCRMSYKTKEKKTDIERNLRTDSLHVAYTYWWSNSGPFIGLCGDEYALVFLGIVKEINIPEQDIASLYTSQKGSIEIVEVLKNKKLKKEEYKDQKYFLSDCFYNSGYKKGDKVIVFCYEYEGMYSIPGKNSILKIDDFDDEIVESVKRYIEANQNPMAIKADMELWWKKGFGDELKQIIDCRESLEKK